MATTSRDDHLPALDGLRAIAALAVVWTHFATDNKIDDVWTLAIGQFGVMLFFVLSGFLMMHVTDGVTPTWANIRSFWRRRFARILPLYYLVLGFIALQNLAVAFWHLPRRYVPFAVLDPLRLLKHVFFVEGFGIFWTIGTELLFYLVFPLLWLARWRSRWFLLALVVGALTFQWLTQHSYTRQFAPTRINLTGHFFLFGVMAYLAWKSAWWARVRTMTMLVDAVLLIAAALALIVVSGLGATALGIDFFPRGFDYDWLWGQVSVLWGIVPLLVILAASSRLAAFMLGSAPVAFLGAISYSIYLTHRFVLRGAMAMPIEAIGVRLLGALAIVVLVSYLSFTFWEKPARSLSLRRRAIATAH